MSRCLLACFVVMTWCLPSTAAASIFLIDIDARVSQGAYAVVSSSGVVPDVRLSYQEVFEPFNHNGAYFDLRGGEFDDEPWALSGLVTGEGWLLGFTVSAAFNVTDAQGKFRPELLTVLLHAQHTDPDFHPTGPGAVMTTTATLGTGLTPIAGGTSPDADRVLAGTSVIVNSGFDRLWPQFRGWGRPDSFYMTRDIVSWHLEALAYQRTTVPEPGTLVLLGLGGCALRVWRGWSRPATRRHALSA